MIFPFLGGGGGGALTPAIPIATASLLGQLDQAKGSYLYNCTKRVRSTVLTTAIVILRMGMMIVLMLVAVMRLI